MKKLRVLFVAILVMGFWVGAAYGQVNNLNEPGSVLVYPLIDNINYTSIIEVVNTHRTNDVWLQGFMITHPPGQPGDFEKKDFFIHLTHQEPFWWDTSQPYSRTDADGVLTQIQGFAGRKGFMFLVAIENPSSQLEIDFDELKGDTLVYGNQRAFRYNAIPHQALAILQDRVLNLDGVEYTMSTSQIICEGFAENYVPGLGGTLAIASPEIDFIQTIQPAFDINVEACNQNEVCQSRHLDFDQFVQYDLTIDLQLAINQVFTPKWYFATTSTNPLWAVFFQYLGAAMWGGQCHVDPATGVGAVVVLPPVPQQ
jgi:hypothetical protein